MPLSREGLDQCTADARKCQSKLTINQVDNIGVFPQYIPPERDHTGLAVVAAVNLGCGTSPLAVRASTLLEEPFAHVKPQEIGALMSNDLLEPSRPPPGSGDGRGRSTGQTPWREDEDFAPAELERMARACLQSLDAALHQVQRWRDAGHDLEDIYLRGIVPSARLLGHWWCCTGLTLPRSPSPRPICNACCTA